MLFGSSEISSWNFLMGFHAFFGPYFKHGCFRIVLNFLFYEIAYRMIYSTLRGFVCASWVACWRGKWVWFLWWRLVQVGVRWETDGFVWKLSDSYHQNALYQVDMWTWTCSCDSRACSLEGLGWWRNVVWRIAAFFGLSLYSDQGPSFRLLFLRIDSECNRPYFLATVFSSASAFNGDLSQWNVAKVTTMAYSKSILILENDVTWGWWWWCAVKMVERCCGDEERVLPWPLVTTYVCGLWLRTVIFCWDFVMRFHACVAVVSFPLWDYIAFSPLSQIRFVSN